MSVAILGMLHCIHILRCEWLLDLACYFSGQLFHPHTIAGIILQFYPDQSHFAKLNQRMRATSIVDLHCDLLSCFSRALSNPFIFDTFMRTIYCALLGERGNFLGHFDLLYLDLLAGVQCILPLYVP
jgi:hypothetical protein